MKPEGIIMKRELESKQIDKKKEFLIGMFCALVGGTLWGISGVCGQFLFQRKGVTAPWLVPIRLTSAGLLLLLYFLIKDRNWTLSIWKDPQNRKDLIFYALAGMMFCQYSYFQTIEWSNAGTATVIQYLGPAMIVIYTCIVNRRRPRKTETAAVILALTGIFLIATHGNPGTLALSARALVMGLLSAVSLVIYTIAPVRLMKEYPAPLVLAWGMLLGGIVLAALFQPWNRMPETDAQLYLVLFVIVTAGTMAAFSLYLHSVHLIGAVRAGLFACVEPVSSALLSAIWMNVAFTPVDIVGFVLIVATVFVLAIPEKRGDITHE